MYKPFTPQNTLKVASAILTISIFPPHASAAQTPGPSSEIGRNTQASTLAAVANETPTEFITVGVSRDGVPNAPITRMEGVFAHPTFSNAAPSRQDSNRPSFFHRILPKFHGGSPPENLPALQLFFTDGDSLIVSPGSPMLPEASSRIHIAAPDGRLHYMELPALQEYTWAGGFTIEKPPVGVPLDQYARGIVESWRKDLKAQGKHHKSPSVSSLKKIIANYNHFLRENDGRRIVPQEITPYSYVR
ncbi:MAG TPA: hypothetical protein VGZ00_08465 [Candidatus Baltobacteraceae bacterium]|jgi:hypothetical protein|nr:hypothetical protein [Candidatus Baltobacteraceae bacterium]